MLVRLMQEKDAGESKRTKATLGDAPENSRPIVGVQELEQRHLAAKLIAEQITAALLKAFQSKDTINGYSPEEWAAMHP